MAEKETWVIWVKSLFSLSFFAPEVIYCAIAQDDDYNYARCTLYSMPL